MSIGDLDEALQSVGPIDIIDFDMCLMAGYETLHLLDGVADYAVFSEELVPGEGNPYQAWVDAIQTNAAEDPSEVAAALVDAFHASYAGAKASTTKSAYSLQEYAGFESALGELADELRANLGTYGSAIDGALSTAQKYSMRELTDLVTFLDSLRVKSADSGLHAKIDALRVAAVGPQFRLTNRVRNGTEVGFGSESDVSRSTGLHVVLPRGSGDDVFADVGPGSFAAYEALYPGLPWTLFVADWTAAQATAPHTDQGSRPFQAYLVWDSASVRLDADVDLWVLEPNGNLYIPWLGSVTPNGTLTNDSYEDFTWFEGYLTNRHVEIGRYRFYAHLWEDPNDHRPVYDVQYRFGFTDPLTSLYDPNYPELSLLVPWEDDPTPTYAEVERGAYTDLQLAAFIDIGVSVGGLVAPDEGLQGPQLAPEGPTSEQLERVRQEIRRRTANRRGPLLPRSLRPNALLTDVGR